MEKVIKVSVKNIGPNPYQPESRLNISMDAIQGLARSIQDIGLKQIPVVRKNLQSGYQMADGWRRLCAYKYLAESGLEEYSEISVIVQELTDRQMADTVIDTNLTKQDLTPIDLAKLYSKFLTDFRLTQTELAKQKGCSQGEIANSLRLLELPEDVQKRIITREITETHGRVLLQLKDKILISDITNRAVAGNWTVAQLDEKVKQEIEKIKPKMNINTPPPITQQPVDLKPDEVLKPVQPSVVENPAGEISKPTETEKTPAVIPVQTVEPETTTQPVTTPPTTVDTTTTVQGVNNANSTNEKPAVEKSTTPAKPIPPVTPPPVQTPWPTKWKRKVVFEEKDGFVLASAMADKGQPIMKRLDGTLDTISLNDFLAETTKEWIKE